MRYASEQDRQLAHLVTAVDLARQGCAVVESLEQAVGAANALRAMGMDSATMGRELTNALNYRDATRTRAGEAA